MVPNNEYFQVLEKEIDGYRKVKEIEFDIYISVDNLKLLKFIMTPTQKRWLMFKIDYI